MGPDDLSSRHPTPLGQENENTHERLPGGDWEVLENEQSSRPLEESSVLVDASPGTDEDSEGSDKWDEARQSA